MELKQSLIMIRKAALILTSTGTWAYGNDAPFHMDKVLRGEDGKPILMESHAIDLNERLDTKQIELRFILEGRSKTPTCVIRANLTHEDVENHLAIYESKSKLCKIKTTVTGETVSEVEVTDSKKCLEEALNSKGKPCGIQEPLNLSGSYSFGF